MENLKWGEEVVMNKEKFVQWLEVKTIEILTTVPSHLLEDKESKAYIRGIVTAMDEIKLQVNSGKFDN